MLITYERLQQTFQEYPITKYFTHRGARINYSYKGKVIISGLMHTSNGYIWGKDIEAHTHYKVGSRYWINFKHLSEIELRNLLNEVLSYRDKLS
ncbi:MAG: hypothetical protein K0Q56_234 [Sporolactobacillus laevolacticus]|nr:hypothetical protein [Sporolactobacillus laevolacticus]